MQIFFCFHISLHLPSPPSPLPYKHEILICFSLFWGVSPQCAESPEGSPWSHPQTSPKQLPWVPVVVQLCWVWGWCGPATAGTFTWSLGQYPRGCHIFLVSTVHRDCQSGFSQGLSEMVLLQLPDIENQRAVRWENPHSPRTIEAMGPLTGLFIHSFLSF